MPAPAPQDAPDYMAYFHAHLVEFKVGPHFLFMNKVANLECPAGK